ncbi:MAG: DNA repair protein RecN, partial [Rikenellaceae bacterium]
RRTGEGEECEQELTILENADRISEVLNLLCARLEDDEHGALRGLKGSINELSGITKSYPAAAEYRDRLVSVLAELKDIDYSIAEMAQRVESDPEKLEKLSNRLGVIFSLCQKHRAQDLDELLAIQDDYRSKLNSVVNSDESLSRLRSEIREAEAKASKIAQQIEDKRKVAAAQISKQICQTLKKLGMAEAQLQIDIKRSKSLNAWGFNDVEFLFSSVKSKTPQPIDRVASGGELSRVMLSFKALLARHKQLPTIIFDEIDTGVSGGIADAMGEIIASLSASLQVVDITHLPQVASKGETHFVVYKEGGHTSIRLLNRSERINQIAMMISGSEISSAALEQAKNLLDA